MGVQFNEPGWLLLLIPAAVLLYRAYRSDYRLSGFRKKLAFGLRTVIILLLVLAISGLHGFTVLQDKQVVYVADRSDSMGDAARLQQWIGESMKTKGEKDRIAVVSTGLEGAVEQKLSAQGSGTSLNASVAESFTGLESGLQLASYLFEGKGDARIVLLSDGEENVGSMASMGRLLKDRGIAVDVLPVPGQDIQDVSVEELKLPDKLYQGEAFSMEVLLNSTYNTSGELRIYEDSREIGRQIIEVSKGENRYAVQGLAKSPGLHRYRAEIFMDGDTSSANNAAADFTRVDGPPRVLIVEGEEGSSGNIKAALDSGMIAVEVIPPELLPLEAAKYAAYDSIIFNNVSGSRVGGRQMEMIEQSVRSFGTGFMMVGGEDSFGMGGYFKTPIEKALPVSMELEGKREIPSLGLILVIDRSGSMSGAKMELVKESAMRTVELLRAKDTVGVVAFDDRPWWVVEPRELGDKKEVLEAIQGIQSSGGTNIYPAVADALEQMLDITTQRRHLILMTDGQSALGSNYSELTDQMVEEKITMSSVAVGMDSDQVLLQSLAEAAKGRYYFVEDETTLPAIFSREAVLLAKSYIVDKPFIPAVQNAGDWGPLFAEGVPGLLGYVATTPKSTAQVVLSSPEPDPILARWQYGSGRTVAWSSDLSGKWSKAWVSWPKFADTLTELVKWTFPQFEASPYEVSAEVAGSRVNLQITTDGSSAPEKLSAMITGEEGQEQQVELVQEAPGRYTGQLDISKPGAFLLSLSDDSGDTPVQAAAGTGFVVPYSPEYKISTGGGAEALQQLAELTGGRVLKWEEPAAVFDREAVSRQVLHDWSYPLLAAALLLWVADIAVRRLALPWAAIGAWLARPLRRQPAAAAEAGRDPGLGRLAARKARAASFYGGSRSGGMKPPGPAAEPARSDAGSEGRGGSAAAPGVPAQRRDAPLREPAPAGAKPAGQGGVPPAEQGGTSMDRLLQAKSRTRRK
ncbi:VWA domain-containing protein [Paenibacillus sp. JSM ZJ436]|uniref:VWA domain-containing protein n=1 Tax=Paenibacillus sp. JSM ZJ436 TaxID=3376190 RepID=UPI003799578D